MLEDLTELRKTHTKHFGKFKEKLPSVGQLYDDLSQQVYTEGAISIKHKRLMALTGALVHGCEACILFQTEKALENGASVDEIMEACSVAVSLGGTMAAGETCRLVRFLEDLGKI